MVPEVINDWWLVLKHNMAEHAVSYFFDIDFLNNDFLSKSMRSSIPRHEFYVSLMKYPGIKVVTVVPNL